MSVAQRWKWSGFLTTSTGNGQKQVRPAPVLSLSYGSISIVTLRGALATITLKVFWNFLKMWVPHFSLKGAALKAFLVYQIQLKSKSQNHQKLTYTFCFLKRNDQNIQPHLEVADADHPSVKLHSFVLHSSERLLDGKKWKKKCWVK